MQTVGRALGDPAEAVGPAAAQQPQQHRLGLIVGVVRGRDPVGAELRGEPSSAA